ncbi:MAG: alpha-L-fucosidase, partial [Planctomycetota bacterium]
MNKSKAAANVDVTIESADSLYSGGNDPKREKWFSSLGLGLFIHWSVDTPLGCVINHGMIGASDSVLNKYLKELPKTFYPKYFEA